MKSYNENVINLFNKTILEDEFNDEYQNKDIYNGIVSGAKELARLTNTEALMQVRMNDDIRRVLNVGSGQFDLILFPTNTSVINLEPCPQRMNESTTGGWSENIEGVTDKEMDIIICWGVLCFVRSLPETMMEFNRVLKMGGTLITDVVSYSTMPLPQTVNPDNFVRWVKLFGFDLEEKIPFGDTHHTRVGYRLTKFEDFNFKRLRMPQCEGKINNYLPERDWFMR